MRLHGRLAEVLAGGDLGVRQPAGRECEDLPLAVGQGGELGRHGFGSLSEVLEELTGRGCGDHAGSGVHGADRCEQELRVGILEQEAARTLPNRPGRRLVEVERRQHDDPRRVGPSEDLGGRRETVHHRHPDVHQHDIRPGAGHEIDRLASVPRLADDIEVGLRREQHAHAGAEQRLIVDEDDSDHATSPIGSDARTTNCTP